MSGTTPGLWTRIESSAHPRPASFFLRVLALLLLALWWWDGAPALAGPTTADQAQQLVKNWLIQDRRPLGAILGQQVREIKPYWDAAAEIQYFVVHLDPAGFVIVPGDDLVEPVIAFAPRGEFDPSPANPLGLLVSRDVPQRVRQARDAEKRARIRGVPFAPKGAKREAFRKWQELQSRPFTAAPGALTSLPGVSDLRVAPLVQSHWSQGTTAEGLACYNYYTPPNGPGDPTNYYCGCVATTMAQIMRYFQFPTAGVGAAAFPIIIDNFATSRALRGGDGAGGPYDWNSMVLNPDVAATDSQRQAIGALTADAGVAARMRYTASGAGAYTSNARDALVNTFSYGNAIVGLSMSTIPTANLVPMINPNLDAALPVYLGIYGPGGGHAVVADGYGYHSNTLYHHLNLGWAGTADAWYNLPSIDTGYYSFDQVGDCLYNIFTSGTGEIISGRVQDGSGNPVPGATVIATQNGGGTYYAATNDNGIYALVQVPSASSYTVTAAKDGFCFNSQSVTTKISLTSTLGNPSYTTGNWWGADLVASPFVIPLGTALDNASLSFTLSGNADWFGQTAVSYYGGSAAQSGAVSTGQSATMQTIVSGPGTLSFYWKVSSQANSDCLEFYLDDTLKENLSGEVDWQRQSLTIPAGPHTVKWTYAKDGSGSRGADCGWVDKVSYSPVSNLPMILQLLLLN